MTAQSRPNTTPTEPSGTAGGEEQTSTSSLRDRQVVIALTYLAALLAVAEAAEAHLHAADGLALGAGEEAKNREVAAAAALSNALYRLDGVIGSANPQKEDGS